MSISPQHQPEADGVGYLPGAPEGRQESNPRTSPSHGRRSGGMLAPSPSPKKSASGGGDINFVMSPSPAVSGPGSTAALAGAEAGVLQQQHQQPQPAAQSQRQHSPSVLVEQVQQVPGLAGVPPPPANAGLVDGFPPPPPAPSRVSKSASGEDEPLLKIGMLLRHWVITDRIGGGAFGETYSAVSVETTGSGAQHGGVDDSNTSSSSPARPAQRGGQEVCIKVEKADKRMVLRLEVLALKKVQACPSVVRYVSSGRHDEINFLVMEKLGENLSELRRLTPNGAFELYTVLHIGVCCLQAIQGIHELGIIHRDIKPSNFVIGNTPETRRKVFLIDFGLAKRYRGSNGEMKPPRENAGFRGTSRYASLNSHRHKELGRVDDLWSLLFMLVEFITSTLPWRKTKEKEVIAELKAAHVGLQLVKNLPREFGPFVEHLMGLDFDGEPNYTYLIGLLQHCRDRRGLPLHRELEWEIPIRSKTTTKKSSKRSLKPGGGGDKGGADHAHHQPAPEEQQVVPIPVGDRSGGKSSFGSLDQHPPPPQKERKSKKHRDSSGDRRDKKDRDKHGKRRKSSKEGSTPGGGGGGDVVPQVWPEAGVISDANEPLPAQRGGVGDPVAGGGYCPPETLVGPVLTYEQMVQQRREEEDQLQQVATGVEASGQSPSPVSGPTGVYTTPTQQQENPPMATAFSGDDADIRPVAGSSSAPAAGPPSPSQQQQGDGQRRHQGHESPLFQRVAIKRKAPPSPSGGGNGGESAPGSGSVTPTPGDEGEVPQQGVHSQPPPMVPTAYSTSTSPDPRQNQKLAGGIATPPLGVGADSGLFRPSDGSLPEAEPETSEVVLHTPTQGPIDADEFPAAGRHGLGEGSASFTGAQLPEPQMNSANTFPTMVESNGGNQAAPKQQVSPIPQFVGLSSDPAGSQPFVPPQSQSRGSSGSDVADAMRSGGGMADVRTREQLLALALATERAEAGIHRGDEAQEAFIVPTPSSPGVAQTPLARGGDRDSPPHPNMPMDPEEEAEKSLSGHKHVMGTMAPVGGAFGAGAEFSDPSGVSPREPRENSVEDIGSHSRSPNRSVPQQDTHLSASHNNGGDEGGAATARLRPGHRRAVSFSDNDIEVPAPDHHNDTGDSSADADDGLEATRIVLDENGRPVHAKNHRKGTKKTADDGCGCSDCVIM